MDQLTSYYDNKHSSYHSAPGVDNAHARILELIGSGHRVLDVGCGSGHLGGGVKRLGNHVVGIEVSSRAASKARQRLDEVLVANVESDSLELHGRLFDVILCADILEHLFDPEALLQRLRPLLAPSGRFILSLPNVAHFSVRLDLLRGRWDYTDIGLLDRAHVRFFTRRTAHELLHQAGLRLQLEELTLSVPNTHGWRRRVTALCARLPRSWRARLAGLVAAQFVLVAEPAHDSPPAG